MSALRCGRFANPFGTGHLNIAVPGAITAVRAVLPAFLVRKSGTVLFTTAASAQHPINRTASFGVAASAALNYARVLHLDLNPEGIHVGIVSIAGLVSRPDKPIPEGLGYPVVSSAQDAERIGNTMSSDPFAKKSSATQAAWVRFRSQIPPGA